MPPLVCNYRLVPATAVDQIEQNDGVQQVAPNASGGWDHGAMKSRLRTLHVDGREYAWKADVRAAPGLDGRRHRCIRIRVWGGGKTGCVLQADVMERSGPAQTEERYPYPTAADVRTLIDHGLRVGWVPATRGGTFQITSVADVALPSLVLTDLLWTAEQRHT
jgi:hypothetical protein